VRSALLVALMALLVPPAFAPAATRTASAPAASAAELDSLTALLDSPRAALAESLANRLLARGEAARDSALMATALRGVGWARLNRKALRDSVARTALVRSVAIESSRRGGPDSMSLGLSEHVLARVLMESGQADASIPHFDRALALLTPRRAIGDSVVSQTWFARGLARSRQRRPAEAIESFERARALMAIRSGARSAPVAYVLTELGSSLADLGRFSDARDTLAFAQDVIERTTSRADTRRVNVLNLRGQLDYQSGDVAGAIEDLQQALDVEIRAYGEQEIHTQPLRFNLAIRYDELGDHAEAIRLTRDALASFERVYGKDHFRSLAARMALGTFEAAAGETASARGHLEAALASLASSGSDPNDDAPTIRRWLAGLAYERGDDGGARRLLDEAITIEHTRAAPTADTYATLMEMQQRVQARTHDRAGLERTRRLLDTLVTDTTRSSSTGLASMLHTRALAEAALGSRDAAWTDALHAEALDRERLGLNTRALPDRQALGMAAQTLGSLDLVLALAAHGDARSQRTAWDRLVRWRGLVAAEIAHRRPPPGALHEPADAAAYARWIDAEQRYAREMVASASDPGAASRLADMRHVAEVAEQDVARRLPPEAHARDEREAGLAEVLAALPSGAALVAACERDAGTDSATLTVFLAPRAHDVQRIELGRTALVRRALDRWLAALSSPPAGGARAEARCRALGARVRALTYDRIAAALGPSREWYLVGDGPLLELPWQALPAASGYLVENGPLIHCLDAERELLVPARAPNPRGLLALGGPRFDAAHAAPANAPASDLERGPLGGCMGAGSLALPELPAARLEAQEAGRTWDAAHPEAPARVLVDAAATEAAFDREAPGSRVVHLATHGIVWGDSCEPAVRTLGELRGVGGVAPLDDASARAAVKHAASAASKAPAPASPRLGRQTWLALAGADGARGRDAGDDGLLTAQEVQMLDLSGVDWVVLSACQSGAGEVWPHQGALGMRRAFRLAGARTVIASQWSLADESAREWVHDLYVARAAGATDAAVAMRDASRAFLAARRLAHRSTHPFYWASFIASGR
jgi:CHAT domain-containing protein/tetratricopeptide (TPR) repeat protein